MPLLALLTATVFLAALLLFLVQPMVGKMLLPLLGGSPGVWNTCMVFFQAMLLAGYGYAHALTRLGGKTQLIIHAAVLLVPAVVLPIALPREAMPPAESGWTAWLLLTLALMAGLPVFAVASAAPLIQRWFAGTDHPAARDPYFLYAASNAGSLLALLAFPFLVEPALTIRGQSLAWTFLYALFIACVLAAGYRIHFRSAGSRSVAAGPAAESPPAPTTTDRVLWLLLAAIPSSLLLGSTTFISTDLASAPLLWVLPLAVYLLTFINAFASRPLIPAAVATLALPLFPLAIAVSLHPQVIQQLPAWGVVALHLAALAAAGLACHGRLAQRRPHPAHLTEFYLLLALGGVLGGAFNTFVAPVVFARVWEYPAALAAACILAAVAAPRPARDSSMFAIRIGYAAVVALAATSLWLWNMERRDRRTLYTERTFFGVHRVVTDLDEQARMLMHGTTIHGVQLTHPELAWRPASYYHPSGPLGQLFRRLYTDPRATAPQRIGVVGLGAGGIAGYGFPGQVIHFFEIDPAVAAIASDPRFFTYLSESPAEITITIGDGRLALRRQPDAAFDLLILDAFSSDAIPIHLLTRQALSEYVRVLAPRGLLVVHISNRYFDLIPMLDAVARAEGLVIAFGIDDEVTPDDRITGKIPSDWAVIARSTADLAPVADDPTWRPLLSGPRVRPWSDDHADLLSVLRWRKPQPLTPSGTQK